MRSGGDILPPDPNPGRQRDIVVLGVLLQVDDKVPQGGQHVVTMEAVVRVQRSGLTAEALMGEYQAHHSGHSSDLLSNLTGYPHGNH